MLKFLCFLVFVAAEASVLRTDLQWPHITHLFGSYPSATVVWSLVPSPSLNPVRGYKVKMWEQRTRVVGSMELVNGEYIWVEKEELEPFTGEIPDWEPAQELIVPGSSSNSARLGNLKTNIEYEFRVQAFTLRGDGPLSPASRINFF